MNEIKLKNDLSTLQKLKRQGTQSTIYNNGDIFYKFLDELYPKKRFVQRFLDMDGVRINNVLLPEDLIIEDGILKGYTIRCFENSIPLSGKFLKRYFNCQDKRISIKNSCVYPVI